MSALVAVATANPAVDITYRLLQDRPGETNRVQDVLRRAGGKGLNVAHVLSVLGVPVRNVVPLGGDSGRWIGEELAADPSVGVVDVVPIAGRTRSTVAVTAPGTHPTVYVEPGPRLSDDEWHGFAAAIEAACGSARFLVLSGSLPAGADPALVDGWVRRGARLGVQTVVDCSGPALLAAADAGADILKPNAEELLAATGKSRLAEGIAALHARGARQVLVSQGADGLVVSGPEGEGVVPAVPGVTGNPTGAGDAATAGLVAALLRGHTFAVAARWAAAAGAAAVRQPVAGAIDLADFDSFAATLGALGR